MKDQVIKLNTSDNYINKNLSIDTTTKFNDFVVVSSVKNEKDKRVDIQIEDGSKIITINGIPLNETETKLLIDFLKLYK